MCGIFGLVAPTSVPKHHLETLVYHARQRGRDSSGLIFLEQSQYAIHRADYDVKKLLNEVKPFQSPVVCGHSRLITNGLEDNQPVIRDDVCVIHNGIIVNDDDIWKNIGLERQLKIDSEVIAAIAEDHINKNGHLSNLPAKILSICEGVIACALVFPKFGKIVLFSNNGSLYVGDGNGGKYFSSESYPLTQVGCTNIKQVRQDAYIIDIPTADELLITDYAARKEDLIPEFKYISSEEKLLVYDKPQLKRCTKCILPETMPFITFDERGVCNYCRN